MEDCLPGLDLAATSSPDSGLRAAAVVTIETLQREGLLTERHALTAQLLVAVAERAGHELQAPKTSIAATNLIRLLADLTEQLPTDGAAGADAATQFIADLESLLAPR